MTIELSNGLKYKQKHCQSAGLPHGQTDCERAESSPRAWVHPLESRTNLTT